MKRSLPLSEASALPMLIRVRVAADALGVSPAYVCTLVDQGRLGTNGREGRERRILTRDVTALLEQRYTHAAAQSFPRRPSRTRESRALEHAVFLIESGRPEEARKVCEGVAKMLE